MVGLGAQEIAMLLALGLLLIGVPILVVVLVLAGRSGGRSRDLETELTRLRERVEQLERKQ